VDGVLALKPASNASDNAANDQLNTALANAFLANAGFV
jgi:hypothetical protein